MPLLTALGQDDAPPGVHFQGEIRHPEVGTWLDWTTLTPLDGKMVRPRIENSRDGGIAGETTFDGIYRRKPARCGKYRAPAPPGMLFCDITP